MTMKARVERILEQGHAAEVAFLEGLPAGEREARGDPDVWAAKDVLAHVAYWKDGLARALEAAAAGSPPAQVEDYEAINQECFLTHRDDGPEDVLAFVQRAHDRFATAAAAMDEEALLSEERWPGQPRRPSWHALVGTGYLHILTHFGGYHAAHGRPEETLRLWDSALALLRSPDPGPRWQALLHYDTACMMAMAGRPEDALEALRQALGLRPGFRQWSSKDPDLASLRDREDFWRLVQE